ncbi:uncharacterized protein LOC128738912 [Sabethes cyaneus]|uniref:uncharacterized protein LOC128738912 n=1 Tax=Sabethes cyaneus TaxID=53552 RepID=UPI00237E58C0|nr:uncharacterized protein LOC128738912 [Sabethes cyaneus]XP_053690369.1 uncharacterized protein LOC128738912 [Sabethes cyaneus]XP_053690370.1 uncharacterized protein LOC128738912 [Sabethes cyaneus]XP_053690371.1 uncharacterized protein LOC128738912 [Sabethes cyaneus]
METPASGSRNVTSSRIHNNIPVDISELYCFSVDQETNGNNNNNNSSNRNALKFAITASSVMQQNDTVLSHRVGTASADTLGTFAGDGQSASAGSSAAAANAAAAGQLVMKNSDCEMKLTANPDGFDVMVESPSNRVRVALGVLIRLLLPLTHGLARGWNGLRGFRMLQLLRKIRETRGLLTTLFAFAANTVSLSLSSVQVAHRIDPLLRVIKLRKNSSGAVGRNALPEAGGKQTLVAGRGRRHTAGTSLQEVPEKFVELVVLAEPPPGQPIRADVVLIHGLHGSLVNTWKQGLWNSEGKLEHFERPPKPPIRPPKRQRHSRANLFGPPHESKKPKFEEEADWSDDDSDQLNDGIPTTSYRFSKRRFTYECGEPERVHFADEMEYSFPTFRLRIEEEGSNRIAQGYTEKNGHGKRKPKVKKDESWSACWPGDWLPLDCPGVRVIALNYTTDPYLWRPVWISKRHRSNLVDRSREMADMLIAKGVGKGHPIVWVGHSKGGIFIKQIIVDAWESGRPSAEPLWRSSRGTLFYSVPHRGSPLADFNLPLLRQSVELTEIQKNCASILELHRRFVALYRGGHLKIDVFSFVETALTLMSVLYLRIVGIDSADPGIGDVCGVHLDHREICKPRSRHCILYTELVKMVNKVS